MWYTYPIYYINLKERVDRKNHVEAQLSRLGLKGNRFEAIKMANGAIGCSMSHLKCLQLAKEKNYDQVMIIEDDISFLDPDIFKNNLQSFQEKHNNWDVLLLGGNNIPPYVEVDQTCIKVTHCQTTTGYIVRKHYYDTIIQNIKTGINYLLKEPEKHFFYAIDKYWINLQKRDKWYLLIPLSVVQKPGYSDIEKRETNYVHMLTSINKKPIYKSPSLPYP